MNNSQNQPSVDSLGPVLQRSLIHLQVRVPAALSLTSSNHCGRGFTELLPKGRDADKAHENDETVPTY